MKNILLLVLSFFALINLEQTGNTSDCTDTRMNVIPVVGDTLIAMEINFPDSNDPYKKYGYEFTGHCYECTVGDIWIADGNLSFFQACEPAIQDIYPYKDVMDDGNQIIIYSEKVKFIFNKIDEAPIYELIIDGTVNKITETYVGPQGIRVAKYYTTKTALNKFDTQDCGEFDG